MLLCLSCATPAPVPIAPQSSARLPVVRLSFDRIEAADLNHLTLWFALEAENPGKTAVSLSAGAWRTAFNGASAAQPVNPSVDMGDGSALEPGQRRVFPVRLDLDPARVLRTTDLWSEGPLPTVPLTAVPAIRAVSARQPVAVPAAFVTPTAAADCLAEISADLVFTGDSGRTVTVPVSARAEFPLVREPEFSITAIAVKRADLINTLLKVTIRIDNGNTFPLEFSGLSYELYGGGRFWAEGTEKHTLAVPARASTTTDLFLMMNFIDMGRDLFNQVVSMRQIDYRFTGKATVNTGIAALPRFRWAFDRAGHSEVID
ncbi:hypothetical protein FACS1894124_8020 [Spirochaetia bacterium]|nr:hypothetical protein FACS1894124_8020 [Spirochaetia bacterium]